MKYFNNIHTLDELKAAYRKLVMIHHPDRGGDMRTMQEINAEHDALFELLKKQHNDTHDAEHQTTETAEEFREILNRLLKLDGIEVELCGSWLWISGETYKHKAELKAAGCRWSSGKKCWYWRHPEASRPWHRGKATMAEIRTKYGSQIFTAQGEETIIGATA